MEITSRIELVELMKHLNLPLTAVEVGVAEGTFSLELLQCGVEKLYLVDLWERMPFISGCASWGQEWHDNNYREVVEKINPYKDKVTILKGFSHKMAEHIPDESLGLVYEDSNHFYDGVKSTIEFYLPKLVKGGVFAFHDFGNEGYGVGKAVQEFTKNVGLFYLPEDGDINNMGAYFLKK